MKVVVGYGYDERDQWIESDVLPILSAMGFDILHGKDLHGQELQDGVKRRIEQSEGLVGFCTLREAQAGAEFNTHPWVRDGMVYAVRRNLPVVEVREQGVKNPAGIVGSPGSVGSVVPATLDLALNYPSPGAAAAPKR